MKKRLPVDTSWKLKTKLEIQDIIMLMESYMDGNYFEYNNYFYEQLEESAMGSPNSPCFAKYFIARLRRIINSQSTLQLAICKICG